MGFLSKLFGKKEKEVVTIPHCTVGEVYNQTASFVDNVKTMDDCEEAGKEVSRLWHACDVDELRNKLCDKTFEIFLQKYVN